jgi:two-component system, sensor histidine kinase
MQPLLLDPSDSLERENEKLRRIAAVLMNRIEQEIAHNGTGYANFQLASALEEQVRARTKDLDDALKMLSISNARIQTARQEAEQARKDLYDALEAVQEGFALFDPDGVLILSNSRFCAHLPDVASKLGPGLNFVDYVRLVARSTHLELPGGTGREEWARKRMVSHRQPHVNFIVRLTGDRWIQVSEYRSPSNGTAVIQTEVSDMIRRERAERDRLLDDQARLVRATLDHIDQGVAIFDAGRLLAGWNRRLRQLVSIPVNLMQTGTDFRSVLNYLQRGGQFAPAQEVERLIAWAGMPAGRGGLAVELRGGDGVILAVSGQETPDGGFVISFTDLTTERAAIAATERAKETLEASVAERTSELEEARDAAERANASKSLFVAGASHDLLQPLNAAKLFLSSLAQTPLDPDQRAITERIQNAYASVEQILGALLDISNLDIGAVKADVTALPVGPLLASLAQEFQPLAAERKLDLRVIPSTVWVDSDPSYLRRILQNLVVNALRYTREGKVLLGARRSGERVRFEVWDTGPGIPADRRVDVFREFVRLEIAPDGPNGMGLGLAIVDRACALLKHPLTLESEPGRGTRFTVTAPRAMDPKRGAAAIRGQEAPPQLDDMIVLVIENDQDVRLGMISVLEDWGASPLEADSLDAARALIADVGMAPDVIVADYLLDAAENGVDAVVALRAEHGPLPAILVTADRSADLRLLAAENAMTLLYKPLELNRLRLLLQWVRKGAGGRGAPED